MVLTDAEIIADKNLRIAYGEKSFFFWFQYHYGFKCKWFHKAWMKSLQDDINTFIEAFRASRKTTIVRGFVVWCAVYKKEPSIVWQSFEDSLSAESVREIAKMMCKKSVVEDHGMIFPMATKAGDLAKKSLSNFETTNGVKIASKSLGQTLRGTNTYDMEEEISARPTLLVLDDIDVVKSVSNVDVINQNEAKILGETIPALDPLRRKIVVLGNTIFEDGFVPRTRNRYKDSHNRNIFRQPLIDDKGANVWPEVFTEDVVAELRDDGKTSFNQNYMLIPSTSGNGVFIRDYFDYFINSNFEEVDGILKKSDLKIGIFLDPAFSSSGTSDDAVILGVGHHKISKSFYLIDGYAQTSAPSRTLDGLVIMYNSMVMNGYKPEFISVESVSINRDQTKFIQDLRAKLIEFEINCPVRLYEPKLKKEARIKDNLEAIMSQKGIKFNRNISDPNFLSRIERQFLEFPNGDHDDIIDTLSQAVEVFRKVPEQSNNPMKAPQRTIIDPRTGRPINKAAGSPRMRA